MSIVACNALKKGNYFSFNLFVNPFTFWLLSYRPIPKLKHSPRRVVISPLVSMGGMFQFGELGKI